MSHVPMPGRTWSQIGADGHEEAEADDSVPAGTTKHSETHRRRIQRTRCEPIIGRAIWRAERPRVDCYRFRIEPEVPTLAELRGP